MVDGLGNPVYFQLSAGNDHDAKLAIDVLSHVELTGSNVLGDKAYGTEDIRNYISSQNACYTIPPKSNNPNPWECDWWIYKERHLVECFLINLRISDVLPPVMISWLLLFLHLFTLPLYSFCLNSTMFLSFQQRPSIKYNYDKIFMLKISLFPDSFVVELN